MNGNGISDGLSYTEIFIFWQTRYRGTPENQLCSVLDLPIKELRRQVRCIEKEYLRMAKSLPVNCSPQESEWAISHLDIYIVFQCDLLMETPELLGRALNLDSKSVSSIYYDAKEKMKLYGTNLHPSPGV